MKFSRAAEFTLVLLVLLSLAGKLAVNRRDQDVKIVEGAFASAVEQQLSQAGFTTKVERWPTGVAVQAHRAACRLWVRDNTPHGTMRNIYENLAKAVGPLRYVYRGTIYEKPPQVDPMLRFLVGREMARVGIATARYPVYAVASSAACDISSLQWPVAIGV